MAEVSRREGVSEMSLSNWRKQFRSEGNVVSETKPSSENWSAETKFAIVLEAAGLAEIDLGESAFFKVLVASTIQLCRSFLGLLLPIRVQHHRPYWLPVTRLT